jgi:ATP-binding cassette, subfamily B, multidrug efflux pump
MKELRYLNKYFIKYKWHLILGLIFVIISNVFQILPAELVRLSIDLVVDNITVHKLLTGLDSQKNFFGVFAFGILIYAGLILIMALLRGIFLYFVRQRLLCRVILSTTLRTRSSHTTRRCL